MSHNESFDVLVTDFAPGDEPPATRLQRVFGIGADAAERLLARLPAPVQRNVPRVRAEYFRRALLKIGAVVEVRDADGVLMEPTASVPPPAQRRPSGAPDAALGSNATWADPNNERAPDTGDVKWLDAAAPAASTPAPFDLLALSADAPPASAGGTADTLVDARVPSQLRTPEPTVVQASSPWAAGGLPLPPSPASAPTMRASHAPEALSAGRARTELAVPAPASALDTATLPDAVRAPAHPTVRDGMLPVPVPVPVAASAQPMPAASAEAARGWGELSAAAAQAPHAASPAQARPAAAVAPAGAAFDLLAPDVLGSPGADASPLALPGMPKTSSFLPPPLELGLGASDGLLTRMPSSVWDAPPPGLPGATQAPRRAPVEIDSPAQAPGSTLDAMSLPDMRSRNAAGAAPSTKHSVGMLAPWEQPTATSMSEPASGAANRRPPSTSPSALDEPRTSKPVPRGKSAEPRAKRDEPDAAAPRADKRPRKRKPSRDEAVAPAKPPEPFAAAWQSALRVPFSGAGLQWIALLCAWAFVAALLSVAAMIAVVPGVLFTFVAMGTLLALASDYFTACFDADGAVTHTPKLSLERIWQTYVKGGAQLAVFGLVVELPVILWSIDALGEGATPLELVASPLGWLLALPASYLWPAALEQVIAQRHLGAVWNVPGALRRIAKAPGAYSASAGIGALVFGLTLALCVALAAALDARGVMLLAAFGPPIALGHGVLGALLRHAR